MMYPSIDSLTSNMIVNTQLLLQAKELVSFEGAKAGLGKNKKPVSIALFELDAHRLT